jgi:spore maturation protein CgeB
MGNNINIPGLSESCLEHNLTALALRMPQLCEWLQNLPDLDEETFQVRLAASGHPNVFSNENGGILLHSPTDPAKEAEEEVRKLGFKRHQPILCLGIGLGYYLEALLKQNNPCQPVLAYERNPWLLCLTLMRSDFTRDILAGRLKFLSPPDLLKSRPQDRQDLYLWPHPVLGSMYGWEERLFALKTAVGGSYRRALVVDGGLFSRDVAEALQENGLEVINWSPTGSDRQEIIKEILLSDPHLIVSINHRHGLPEISSTLGIPLLVWEIDPNIERLAAMGTNNPYTYIYTYRKSNVAKFREAGFEHVEYLPMAANPKRTYPMDLTDEDSKRYGADVSFTGSSMVGQAEVLRKLYVQLTRGKSFPGKSTSPIRDYSRLWELALEEQRHNPDRFAVAEVFQKHLLDGSWVAADSEQHLVDLTVCAAETAASQRRAQALTALSNLGNGASVRVWGDNGWRRILPETIQYSGPVGHFYELTKVYNASRINLDINRIYQRDIVTMRIFDVLACKGFVLADYSGDLGELFALDSEVVAYRSISEIPSLVSHFLSHPHECEEIAQAGYEKALKEHTIKLRTECMLNNLP